MAFTSSDLDAIDRAIASGELTVRSNDRMVTYRSMDELTAARAAISGALAAASASTAVYPRYQLADFSDD
ncbi:MAG: hypothetical protein KBH41_19840 [Azonexus sp.]|jgi:hypothetical protein|nr:hypothetical protein [Azonexus sp.]